MRSRFVALALTAALCAAAPVQAQTHFQFTDVGAGYTGYGYYIGTYGGTQNFGGPNATHVGLNCVDFFHHVTWGEQWDANITNVLTGGNASLTRNPGGLSLYREAAWLISNYTASNVAAIQATVWNLFQNTGLPSDPTWLAAAQAPHPGFDYGQYYVVTDVNANGETPDGTVQEFIVYDPTIISTTATPEPATAVLFGTGFAGLAGLALRRRKQQG